MKRAAAVVCLVLVAGCGGLPLGNGVRQPGEVPAEERQGGDIQVLPPGPRDDATPADIVRDFFGAQSSPEGGHASAREFLAPELRAKWRDTAPVGVLESSLSVSSVGTQPNTLHVAGVVVAEIAADGSYTPGRRPVDFDVQVRRGPRGRPLITDVPNGLLLSAADRERSFRPRGIYFLAPPSGPGAAASHLAPDQVFLPLTADKADGLVRRLIAGPSRALGDSVTTAFPRGTQVRSVTDVAGLVTVDLTGQVGRASEQLREQMSAQLVWTLRGIADFTSLRFLSDGKPVVAGNDGQGELRDRTDWQPYDPDGLSASPPLYYIAGRRLRQLEPSTSGPASVASQQQQVDVAAASPRGGGYALIARSRAGAELRTGPASGPFVSRARAASLSFLSWGSGEQGVWYLQNGRVKLAPLNGRPVDVPVDGLGGAGPISGVRVSRDGVRVGLILGIGTARRLFVGRLAERGGGLRVVDARNVAPGVRDVHDLAWDGSTSLVVLGQVANIAGPIQVAVDGSAVALVPRVGLEQSQPTSLAAAPGQPLVVAASSGLLRGLYRASGPNRYVREPGVSGSAPFYPG